MPEIPIKLDINWDEIKILKEIEEKHWNSHKIVNIIKMIANRNISVICKLFEYIKENDGEEDDIKTFIEKYW